MLYSYQMSFMATTRHPHSPINKGTFLALKHINFKHIVLRSERVKMNSLSLIATTLCCIVVFGGLPFSSNAKLHPFFYGKTCPQLHSIVYKFLLDVSRTDTRMPASIIRLHFHDCFVQVCINSCFVLIIFVCIN
jgi:hypothetical protein